MSADPHAGPAAGPQLDAGDVHKMHALDKVVERFGHTDDFVASGEQASPWVPFIENVYIRHLSFDVRNNSYVNILRVDSGGRLGRYRHRVHQPLRQLLRGGQSADRQRHVPLITAQPP